jgi:protein O-GlcNAc transferase
MNARDLNAMLQTAAACLSSGKLEQAESLCQTILKSLPDAPDVLHLLGRVYLQSGRNREALDTLQRATSLKPSSAVVQYDLAEAAWRCNEFETAEAGFRSALQLDASMNNARAALGEVVLQLGRVDEAQPLLEEAVQKDPAHPLAAGALATIYNLAGRLRDAVALLQRAISASPQQASLHHDLAIALQSQGRLTEAVEEYRQTLRIWPTWQRGQSNLLYCLNALLDDPAELFAAHMQFALTVHENVSLHTKDRRMSRRLRIGYLSAGLCEHPVSIFLEPVLAQHDRSRFEVLAYSDAARGDAVSQRLRALVDHWHDVARMQIDELAARIRADKIDILVDLSLHGDGGKRISVLARKPAPVQVAWLGYAGTTGLPTVDWRITDSFIDPPGATEAFNSERLMRLPRTQWVYQPPESSPAVNELPAKAHGHITFGSINRLDKFSPRAIELWSHVLSGVPTASLAIKARGVDDPPTQQLLRDAFAVHGVEPTRLRFSGFSDMAGYLRFFHEIDVVLDTYPFAGGTSTCHALWMGVPVITRAGRTAVSRVGVSVLNNVALSEFVAESDEMFVRIATRCASDVERLATIRTGLRERMSTSALCDAAAFTRDLEAAYLQMWQAWLSGSDLLSKPI